MRRFFDPRWVVLGCAVLAVLVLDPAVANAFKHITHLWVAQQVLNDVLLDGKVSIGYGEYRVDPSLVDALRQHEDEYRMGHIGPDAFPDLVVGQLTAHPGLHDRGGWPTDQWLEWVVSAAGDDPRNRAFAYGYLGHAAGDIFAHSYVNWYSGGVFALLDSERHVEVRHYALESYIASYTPPLRDVDGYLIIPGESLATPTEFIRENLILSKPVAEEYRRVGVLGAHLVLMYEIDRELENLERELVASLATADPRERLLRSQVEAAVAQSERLTTVSRSGDRRVASAERAFFWSTAATGKSPIDLPGGGTRIGNAGLRPARVPGSVLRGATTASPEWHAADNSEPYAVRAARESRMRAEMVRARAATEADSLVALLHAHQEARRAEVREGVTLVRLWRRDIKAAVEAYVAMSHRVMVKLVQGNNPQGEIIQWLACWGYVLGEVPEKLGSVACKLHKGLTAVYAWNSKVLGSIQSVLDPQGKIAGAVASLEHKFLEAGLSVSKLVLSAEQHALIALLALKVDSRTLTDLFDAPGAGTLISISDVAARVQSEMHLDGGRYFDPERFAPAHNAVVLTKLSLLGPEELNRLVREHGGPLTTAYGENLYTAQPGRPFNVLFGAVRSIDGSDQWQEYARGYLRAPQADAPTTCDPVNPERRFGYGLLPEQGLGLRLWADANVRRTVFNRIFIGPLSPAMDTPGILGFSDPVPPGYPFVRPTAADPFPLTQCKR